MQLDVHVEIVGGQVADLSLDEDEPGLELVDGDFGVREDTVILGANTHRSSQHR